MTDYFDDFPIVRSFDAFQNQDWTRTFTYKINGLAVDLSQYSAEFVVFDEFENIIAKVTSPTGVVLGGTAGTITPKLAATTTKTLSTGSYLFMLWLINGSSQRTPFARGRFNIGVSASA